MLQSATLDEMTDMSFAIPNDIITLLSARFGWKSLFIVGHLLCKFPFIVTNQLEEQLLAGVIGELGRTTTLEES